MQNELTIDILRQWNEKTADTLYNTYYRALVVFSKQIVKDVDTAEDIVQDVLSALWEKKIGFENLSQFRVYMYNAVRNRSLKYVTRNKHLQVSIDNPDLSSSEFHLLPTGDEDFYSEEIYRRMILAIESLPDRQRSVFLLAIEGKKNSEIAEVLHISEDTVKTHRKRGMVTLREKMSDDMLLLLSILIA
ncbi:MAG: RNA polymerase sigma-70 factor [Prevotella sp.]|nr:RNA polymerase sigma-70 factor [Prevotella sp.]